MQPKHIIVGILALGGLIGAGYNWMSYFKASAPGPAVTASRPAASQAETTEKPAGSSSMILERSPAEPEDSQTRELTRKKVQWPETLGRNPFLTPGEVELIASGEWVEEVAPVQVPQNEMAMLPDLDLTGLILDRATGKYRALIGGKAYNTGDQLGQETVVEITADSVILQYGGRTRTVTLKSNREKGKSSSGVTLKKAP
jgi:hypothetical protein